MKKAYQKCGNNDCLFNVPLFRDLPKEMRLELTRLAKQSHQEKDTILFEEGDQVQSIFIIRKGRIKRFRYDVEGKEHIVDILHDGDAMWETLYTDGELLPYTATCITDVELCEIKKEDFKEILRKEPHLALHMIQTLSKKLYNANQKMKLMAIKNPLGRVAGLLLEKDVTCLTPEIHLKLEDIAGLIDLRPETVSRCISKLEKDGFIQRVGRGKISVTNRKGLLEIFEEMQ